MAEPALKVATDLISFAIANFDMSWPPSVEHELAELGLDLTDLHNALTCCGVEYSNTSEAEGVYLVVSGFTTDDTRLEAAVWINTDACFFRVERVFQGREPGDDNHMCTKWAPEEKCANVD